MGKNKIILLLLVFAYGCSMFKVDMNSEEFSAKYFFRHKFNTNYISFEFFQDSTIHFEQVSGMDAKYSKGIYRFQGDSIIINSVYSDKRYRIPTVSWKVFKEEVLLYEKNRLIYGTYILKKEKNNSIRRKGDFD